MKGYALVESTYFDSLKGIDEIINFGTARSYSFKNKHFFKDYQERVKTLGFTQTNLSLFADVFSGLIIVGVLTSGAVWVVEGKFLLGEMMAAYSLLANILPAVNRFVDANIVLQESSIASTRLMDMLLIDAERREGKLQFEMNNSLSIKNGSFSWNGRNYIFQNIDLILEKGKITSLWGSSGAGKSTIVQLLQRKYKLDSGNIFVDNINAEEINLAEYRKNIGVVPQTIKIFNGTILENILVGRDIKDYAIIERRIAEFGLLPFYQRFEYGLATIIGEDGRELSGGEKQLISITRALLDNPKVLIIDEGLSGIDIELEKIIFDVIKDYSKENAVLLITHNMNSIMKTDFVYVLANGTISQKGTPQLLISTSGYFNKMWKMKEEIYSNKKVMINE